MAHRSAKRLKSLYDASVPCTCRSFASSSRILAALEPNPGGSSLPPSERPYTPQRITFLPGVDQEPRRTDGPPVRKAQKARDIISRTPENLEKLMGQDAESYQRTKGKLFLAPEALFRADRARFFPNVSAKTPRREVKHTADLLAGKVSLVAILNSRLSEQHLDSYLSRTQAFKRHAGDPDFQHLQITHMANSAFGPIAWLFYREQRQVQGHAVTQLFTTDDIRRKAFYEHAEYGYLFIVDPKQRIRWASVGEADESAGEVEAMDKCLDVLLERRKANLMEW